MKFRTKSLMALISRSKKGGKLYKKGSLVHGTLANVWFVPEKGQTILSLLYVVLACNVRGCFHDSNS